ncbi:copper resistance protein CopC [Novosphingobium sp. Leaf2]|uniref:copper resistance protein CopC n=1 Tax=Novosphingobium sp. Leaf2 TaxID=1735670 RepID=UPI0007010BA1|nr:copper resistance protein CopC [Novosphingobium sp. Leaf2]KQM19277.1 copper resistance protein CopC [Novosphingobium sp. Leaf2]
MHRNALAVIAAVAISAIPVIALAQPHLVASTPAAETSVEKPTAITLRFSEKLAPAVSGLDITMTAMPGMANHAPMKVAGFTAQVAENTITVALPRALPAGTYSITWRAAGLDGQPAQGDFGFAVR